jgi:predicted dienelactone hydrolase
MLRKLTTALVVVTTLTLAAPMADLAAAPRAPGRVAAPTEVGPYAVGRTTTTMTDPDRAGRTLTVDVWYPSDAAQVQGVPKSFFDLLVTSLESPLAYDNPPVSAEGGFPLVVFSHGNAGTRLQSWFLTEFLASHGFVVAAPDHAGNTALDQLFGTTTPFAVSARNRPLDVSLIIDRMLERDAAAGDLFEDAIDGTRIAVAGHSFGAFTALAMAAGHVDVSPDPRVGAIVPISPVSAVFSDEQLSSITTPILLVGGTSDTTTPITPNTTRVWELVSSKAKYRVDVERAGHGSFTNICDLYDALIGAGLPPELLGVLVGNAATGCAPELIPVGRAQDITNLYVLSFLQRELVRDGRYQPFLTPGYARSTRLPVTFLR